MNYWDVIDALCEVETSKEHYVHGISRPRQSHLGEGIGALIQKAAMDWLSTEFKDASPDEVRQSLLDNTDKHYDSWVAHAEKIHGINSIASQQTGWEMIMGHAPWNANQSLVNLPGGDRYY